MTKRKAHKIAKPSILSFTRAFSLGTGFFYSNSQPTRMDAVPLVPQKQTLRAVFNAATTKKDINKEILKSQVIENEVGILPAGHDWLVVTTSLIVSANNIKPLECNEPEFAKMINEFINAYSKHGFYELCKGYVGNIVSGRWLWRNKTVAQNLNITINGCYNFCPDLNKDGAAAIINKDELVAFEELCQTMAKALIGNEAVKFDIVASVNIGEGQEIYPSQSFVTDKQAGQGRLLQTTHNDGVNQLIFTPQKISNALRWIDVWYDDKENLNPLPVEAYGIERSAYYAHRYVNKNSIYDLLNVLPSITEELDNDIVSNDAHYVMACLIRGGLYQQKESSK